MKLDASLLGCPLAEATALARSHEEAGFDGVFTFDGPFEPFASLALAAGHTGLDIATGVAIAFARNPMTVAQAAHDLQGLSGGRFRLGLGTQIRTHVEQRFSMPWDRPRARLREFVAALKAIFACWNEDAPLRFEGAFYTHTRMPPLLRPAPCPHGRPPIELAAVGQRMIETAAEIADGWVVHPFHGRAWLDAVARPALATGRARRAPGVGDATFAVTAQVLVVTGASAGEMAAAREAVRAQVAFYASTPAYRGVLDADGLGHLQQELRDLTREGRWSELAALVSDDVLERYAVCAEPTEAGRELASRYRGLADRVALASPFLLSPEAASGLVAGFRGH